MWKKVEYEKKDINKAGEKIIDPNMTPDERANCLRIIDNWRAAHAFPTNTFAIHLKHLVQDIPTAVVVQRLKRRDTIVQKLERFPTMKLHRMQDLGGCRVILPKVADVYDLVKQMRSSRIRHEESISNYSMRANITCLAARRSRFRVWNSLSCAASALLKPCLLIKLLPIKWRL